jgi:hypothetical protein
MCRHSISRAASRCTSVSCVRNRSRARVDHAVGEHVIILVAPLAGRARGGRAFKRRGDERRHNPRCGHRHLADAAMTDRLEGIVSKRLGSINRSGKCKDWLKFKNPDAPAVKRESEEDWGKERWR